MLCSHLPLDGALLKKHQKSVILIVMAWIETAIQTADNGFLRRADGLSLCEAEELDHYGGVQSRVAAALHKKEMAKAVTSWVRCLSWARHVGGGRSADPGHTNGWMFPRITSRR